LVTGFPATGRTLRNNNWIQLLFRKVQNAFVAKVVKQIQLLFRKPVQAGAPGFAPTVSRRWPVSEPFL
jgi:hypothetical protein